MKKRNKIIYFGAVVLSIIMITASASVLSTTNVKFEKNVKIVKTNATPMTESLEATRTIEFITIENENYGTRQVDIQVTDLEEDELEPAIGWDPDGEYLLAYTYEEDIGENHIPWRFSIDGGATWDPGVTYPDILGIESHPAISYAGVEKKFSGTIQGDPDEGDGAYQFRFMCDDPTDSLTYSMTYWDWSASYPYSDRLIPDIGGYRLADIPWWYGMIACVGTRGPPGSEDMPIFNYANYEDEGSGWAAIMLNTQAVKTQQSMSI
jgi:hypothetical protein